ncbi:hypothetical protein [Arthrobacter sp. UYCu723]
MTAAISVAKTPPPQYISGGTGHVFSGPYRLGQSAVELADLIAPEFLAEIGWDPVSLVMFLPPAHLLLGRPVCAAVGCAVTAPHRGGICTGCRHRLARQGLVLEEIALLPAKDRPDRGVGMCGVAGCAREWASGTARLCRRHLDQQQSLGLGLAEFLTGPRTRALEACPPCAVAACPRQRRHLEGRYCDAHQIRLRVFKAKNPGADEALWRRIEPPIGTGGQVSLRGLEPLVVIEVLLGLQQRCRLDQVRTKEAELRAVGDDLRRQQVDTIADYRLAPTRSLEFAGLVHALARHARRALSTPAAEILLDQWDLAVFGNSGTVSFTGLSQPWLREAAKRWAIDDLPRRRIRPGRRSTTGLSVRHHVNALVRLSEALRMRPDQGRIPAGLGRADIETFLNRLAYLASTGQISTDARLRTIREVRHVLSTIRALGLTRPGTLAAGLGEDFTIGAADIPAEPEAAESGRDLPPEIMRQICAHLDRLTSPPMRAGIELAIDTGRRPEEIAALAFDCLARDADGSAVLVFDNHKAGRLGRRLPINANTAEVITAQQQWVRARYPHTPVGELKLLPTDRRNPGGDRSLSAFSLAFHHRVWITNMPVLRTVDDTEFDKALIVLYAYRHTYAQRHADAGVPIDVLRELMDHRKLDTTSGYYQVGQGRRREAVDRVTAMQFNRHGERIWRQAQELLDSDHARRSVGEVVVPFGLCTEPSNVQAGGNACPYRFRCVGCDHFRTDVSYLPDLQAHLDDLLRNREKLLATQDLEEWARTEALPSENEITRIRRLISKVEAGLDQLAPADRTEIEQAVTIVRRHRTTALGMPQIRQPVPDVRPRPVS